MEEIEDRADATGISDTHDQQPRAGALRLPDEIDEVLAIDPGPEQSAWLLFSLPDNAPKGGFGICPNENLLDLIYLRFFLPKRSVLAIEMVESYGMPVGREVFQTVLWIGRFVQEWIRDTNQSHFLVPRVQIKTTLCGSARAKDPNIRQRLLDIYGPVGTKRAPGRLYGIKSHLWSALAIATYVALMKNGHHVGA